MAFSHARNVDARYSSFINHGDQYIVVSDTQGGTQQGLTERDLFCNKIHHWLSPPDASTNHNDACEKRHDSTGKWFVEDQRFSNWMDVPNSFIWLYGMPGCGKTVLCSNVIEKVASHCSNDPSLALAYFYFDFNDERKQLVRNLICSLVSQFASQYPYILDGLATLHSSSQQGRQQPTTASLTKILRDMISGFRHTYIVLDALDECAEQRKLLAFIEGMTDWRLDGLHILVTSRPERMIHVCLDARVSDAIDIQSALVDADIGIYIRHNLQNDIQLCKYPPELKEVIEVTLMEGAKGM